MTTPKNTIEGKASEGNDAVLSHTTRRTVRGGLAVRFTCPECGQAKKADALTDAGERYRCECGAEMVVPGREEAEQFIASRRKKQAPQAKQAKQAKQTPRTATVRSVLLVQVENPVGLGMNIAFGFLLFSITVVLVLGVVLVGLGIIGTIIGWLIGGGEVAP